MKRTEFLKYLRTQGCEFIREGAWLLGGGIPAKTCRSSIPRHTEISDSLARKICRDLGIEAIK